MAVIASAGTRTRETVRLDGPWSDDADSPLEFYRGSPTVTEPQGGVPLLNKSGGRAAAIWTGNATAGQRIGQRVDNSATGSWNLVKTGDGFCTLRSVRNLDLYLTGASDGAPLTLQHAAGDGSQEWKLRRSGG